MSPVRSRFTLFLALPALAACASTSSTDEVRDLVRVGEYARALELASRWAEDEPYDEDAVLAHRMASVAYQLEKARALAFEDRDVEALVELARADAIAPDEPAVDAWIAKESGKLAERWLDVASEAQSGDRLLEAEAAYENVLRYMPGDHRALDGLSRVILQQNYRAGLSETYYKEGVRAMRDHWLVGASNRLGYASKYAPDDQRVAERRAGVQRELAGDRLAFARQFESQGFFSAARNEFRLVLLLDPDNEEALVGRERNDREVRAGEYLGKAQMQARRGETEAALISLDQGQALTQRQLGDFEQARQAVRDSAIEESYLEAKALEDDGHFEAAVGAYERILREHGYYKDSIARKQLLEGWIEQAGALYEQSLAASTSEAAAGFLRQIAVFWPDYRDVRERLARLGEAIH
jgi:hypothetical protein